MTKPENAGTGVAVTLRTGDYVNMRPAPAATAEPPVQIWNGTHLTWYPATETDVIDGFRWCYVETEQGAGWMARVWPTWVEQFIPRGTPGVVETQLDVPWLSQVDAVTAPDANDCGPAAVAMALRYLGGRLNMAELATVTPKAVNARIDGGQDGTDTDDLVNAFKAYGIDAAPSFNMTVGTVQAVIASGVPAVVLVQRGKLPELTRRAPFSEGHWLTVTGYGPGTFTVNDALVPDGKDIPVAASNMQQALAGSTFLGKTNSPFLGVIAEPGVPPPVVEESTPDPEPEVPPVVTPPDGLVALHLSLDEARQYHAALVAERAALADTLAAKDTQIRLLRAALERAGAA